MPNGCCWLIGWRPVAVLVPAAPLTWLVEAPARETAPNREPAPAPVITLIRQILRNRLGATGLSQAE